MAVATSFMEEQRRVGQRNVEEVVAHTGKSQREFQNTAEIDDAIERTHRVMHA